MEHKRLNQVEAIEAWLQDKIVVFVVDPYGEKGFSHQMLKRSQMDGDTMPDKLLDKRHNGYWFIKEEPIETWVAWEGPQDVPEGLMWMRFKDHNIPFLPLIITENGVDVTDADYDWNELVETAEWSDSSRKVWQRCGKKVVR